MAFQAKRALLATRYVSSLLKMSLVYSIADASFSRTFFATGASPEACSATTVARRRGCGDLCADGLPVPLVIDAQQQVEAGIGIEAAR